MVGATINGEMRRKVGVRMDCQTLDRFRHMEPIFQRWKFISFHSFFLSSVHVTSPTHDQSQDLLHGNTFCDWSLTADVIVPWELMCSYRILVHLAGFIRLITSKDYAERMCVERLNRKVQNSIMECRGVRHRPCQRFMFGRKKCAISVCRQW